MKNTIYKLIKHYNSIIIARHKNPDFDAYGSQFGLYYALKEHYPNKKIYVVGDTNSLNKFGELDDVDETIFKKSLVIILDTVSSQMLDKNVYKNYDKLIMIDHHRNESDIESDLIYQNIESSSTSEIIAEFLMDWNIPITKKAARALYIGIIGDTGRFMYDNTTAKTFMIASKLVEKGINIAEIHSEIYVDSKKSKKIKNEFFRLVKYTKNNVAYKKNDVDFIKKYNLTVNYVSRGLVNQMAGMKEVPIWSNFTFDEKENIIIAEFRSRDYNVLDVAKKYGGGGHLHASGCILESWNVVDEVIKELDNLLEEKK